MNNEDRLIMEGIIDKIHGKNFEVLINNNFKVLAILKGKLKQSKIQFVVGDKVKVELNTTDPSKGYIIERL